MTYQVRFNESRVALDWSCLGMMSPLFGLTVVRNGLSEIVESVSPNSRTRTVREIGTVTQSLGPVE